MTFFANCRLVQIDGPPDVDWNGTTDGTGATLWSGSALAYIRTRDRQVVSSTTSATVVTGQANRVKVTTLHIMDSAGAPVLGQPGPAWQSTSVVVEKAGALRRWTVVGAEHHVGGTLVDSLRLELDNERPA